MTAVFTQVYEYKGKRYEVMGICQMKHPDTRQWIPAIVYRSENRPGENFTRAVDDFMTKFRLIEARPLKAAFAHEESPQCCCWDFDHPPCPIHPKESDE